MEQANHLLYFFALLLIGYGAARVRLLPDSVGKGVGPLLMNLCYPAMIISTFANVEMEYIWNSGMRIVLCTLAINFALILVSGFVLRRKEHSSAALMRFMLNIGNITYVGIPLLSIFLPESMITLVILHGSVQDFLIWLYFYPAFLVTRKKQKISELIGNPCLIALLIGLVLMLLPFDLPEFASMTVSALSGMTTPLAALYLGTLIARYGIFSPLKSRTAIRYALVKVVAIPAVVFACIFPFMGVQTALLLAVLYGCPAPLMSVIWAQQYDADVEQTGSCCIVSTLLFLLVAPIILTIYCGLPIS